MTANDFVYYNDEVFAGSAFPLFFKNGNFKTKHRVYWWFGDSNREYIVKTRDAITFESTFYQSEFYKEEIYDLLVTYLGEVTFKGVSIYK